jgi:hypothetical protein
MSTVMAPSKNHQFASFLAAVLMCVCQAHLPQPIEQKTAAKSAETVQLLASKTPFSYISKLCALGTNLNLDDH